MGNPSKQQWLLSVGRSRPRLSYALLTDTPFGNCLTTMTVRDLGPSQAELEWSATFEADGLPASEAAELMEGALAANGVARPRSTPANKLVADQDRPLKIFPRRSPPSPAAPLRSSAP